ncbi:MAG: type I-D CRISPR-associated endonuclease Cas1 [Deltaproteobacteria bacterium]|nr:MAG: type I-D CRISPR-associated endonuclease Cas1 [Deltaproteobacteria bacterium]
MSTLYITQEGAILRKTDERLRVTLKDETLIDIPLIKVSSVVILGRATVTSAAADALMQNKIPLSYLTAHGRFIGRLEPAFSKNCLLRREQYALHFDEERRLEVARRFVGGKVANMRVMLRRAEREGAGEGVSEAIRGIKRLEKEIPRSRGIEELLGQEGAASSLYFGVFDDLLRAEGFSFEKRIRRPPTDPVNALLSFGYALLAGNLHALLEVVGFDPYIGFLHADRYGRASLALDLMEEFRPVIVDSVVLLCINKRILRPDHFESEITGACRLTPEGRKLFLTQYERRKLTEVQHPVFGYRVSYHRCAELQARLLAKFVQGEIEEYLPFRLK